MMHIAEVVVVVLARTGFAASPCIVRPIARGAAAAMLDPSAKELLSPSGSRNNDLRYGSMESDSSEAQHKADVIMGRVKPPWYHIQQQLWSSSSNLRTRLHGIDINEVYETTEEKRQVFGLPSSVLNTRSATLFEPLLQQTEFIKHLRGISEAPILKVFSVLSPPPRLLQEERFKVAAECIRDGYAGRTPHIYTKSTRSPARSLYDPPHPTPTPTILGAILRTQPQP